MSVYPIHKGFGEDVVFGSLFRIAFRFAPELLRTNDALEAKYSLHSTQSLAVSVHVRHISKKDDGTESTGKDNTFTFTI